MKGVSHGKRLKPCSRTSGACQQWRVSKPGEANRRAAAQANSIEPRKDKTRVASASDCMKPASLQEPTRSMQGTLRGSRRQRDGKEMLGTWENPQDASGGSRLQPVAVRNHKHGSCFGDVGEAHSSDEGGESRWSEGALATDKPTEKAIGADWRVNSPPTTEQAPATECRQTGTVEQRWKLHVPRETLGRRAKQERHTVNALTEKSFVAKAGCGKSARPV